MKTRTTLLLALLLLLGGTTIALAADATTVLGYEIEFLGAVDNAGVPATSTWTYAITADGDESAALSHWVLELDLEGCMTIVSPEEASLDSPPWAYVTPTTDDYGFCASPGVNCVVGNYEEVEYGRDPVTGVNGIKFGDATNNGSGLEVERPCDPPKTHIFEIELAGVSASSTADVPVGIKTSRRATGLITGPVCPTPSAITLDRVTTRVDVIQWPTYLFLAFVVSLVPVLYVVAKRQYVLSPILK